jgi:predicted MFS family arabinose efflux permease
VFEATVEARREVMRLGRPGALFGMPPLDAATRRPLAIALATSVVSVLGVQLVFPLLPGMVEALDVAPDSIGLVIAAYAAPIAVVVPFTGALADLHGRRLLLVVGLGTFGLAGTLLGLAPTFEVVLLLRVLQGIGAGMILPLTVVLLSDLLPAPAETAAQGLKVVLDRLAVIVVPVLAGVLSLAGGQLPFLIYGLAIPLALAAFRWMPETRPPRESSSFAGYLRTVATGSRRPRVLMGLMAGSMRFFLDYGFLTFLPIYLGLSVGYTAPQIGLTFAGYGLGAIITASQVVRLARARDPAATIAIGFALAAFSLMLLPLARHGLWIAVCVFTYGLGNGIVSPLQKSLMTRNAPADARTAVIAVDRTLQQVAKAAAPIAMGGVLAIGGIASVFWVLGSLAAAVVVALWVMLAGGARASVEATHRG